MRKPVLIVAIICGMTAISGSGQITPEQQADYDRANATAGQCPDLTQLRGLCGYVNDRSRAPAGSPYRYEFQAMVHRAACANASPANAPENVRRIQQLWRDHPRAFTCDSSNFQVPGGSILKYAVSSRSFQFVRSAVSVWHLDLNVVDRADGQTILDFVQDQLERNRGNDVESQLREYHTLLRAAGVRYAHELPARQ